MADKEGRPGARRIRTLKPEILSDAKMRRLPDRDWRLFVSTILLCDDEGRFEADATVVGPDVFGYSATEKQVEEAMLRLHQLGLLELWTHGGRRLGRVCGWKRHQKIDRPSVSRLPGPFDEGSTILPGGIVESSTSPRGGRDPDPDPDPDRIRTRKGGDAIAAAPPPPAVGSSPILMPKPCCSPPADGSRIQAVAWRFCQLHHEKLGAPYPHNERRDIPALNSLPDSYTIDLLLELLEDFFLSTDRFITEKRGFKIPVFVDQLSALLKARRNAAPSLDGLLES